MDQSLGTSKWSRNFSEDSQSESNRLRLIERQRQLLETKLQRQHQVIATTTRPSTGRVVKSALSSRRSSERLIDLEDLNSGNVVGVVNTGISTADEYETHPNETPKSGVNGSQRQLTNQSQPKVQSIQMVSPLSSPKSLSNDSKSIINLRSSLELNKNLVQNLNINLDKSVDNLDKICVSGQQELIQLNPLNNILTNEELLLFATQPISPQTTLQCTIIRDKKGLDRSLYPTYYMHLQGIQVFLLSGRRRKKSKTYIIGNDPFDISRGNCIAKLKSNVLGTQFTAIRINSSGQRQEIATIIYETNVLGFKGPRRMTVLIPKYEQLNNLKNLSIFEEWKRNNRSINQLKNKTPVWNDETQSYVLNFRGRVTQASVKNFQLVTCNEKEDIVDLVSMQFGRVSASQFSCDVSWPMTLLQAFAIALSSFDSKLACE
ncbi:tubby protein-like [Oppia nitens]|uniref:tubby protein-like n=1 Tax=Oppia nitens TaxID=1686743 RepID=UPI0023DC14EF|nr:tubby protein-like [Oppia nitens]